MGIYLKSHQSCLQIKNNFWSRGVDLLRTPPSWAMLTYINIVSLSAYAIINWKITLTQHHTKRGNSIESIDWTFLSTMWIIRPGRYMYSSCVQSIIAHIINPDSKTLSNTSINYWPELTLRFASLPDFSAKDIKTQWIDCILASVTVIWRRFRRYDSLMVACWTKGTAEITIAWSRLSLVMCMSSKRHNFMTSWFEFLTGVCHWNVLLLRWQFSLGSGRCRSNAW
jgi:hypothetical protein